MKKLCISICVALVLLIAVNALAQSDLTVGEIDIGKLKWGSQRTTFDVTNNSDWMRYVAIETEIVFKGSYLTPSRTVHQYYSIEPGEKKTVDPKIELPGNYGKATLYFRIYDVIDTLDVLMESQKVFEQPFMLRFRTPNTVAKYLNEKILLPPMVDNNTSWDNEFAHLLPIFLSEKKTVEEIAQICETTSDFVIDMAQKLVTQGFLYKNKDGSYRTQFPVITVEHAEEVKTLVEKSSDDLVRLITSNFALYDGVLDSLIDAKTLTKDKNDFLHGGTVLYSRYPVVAGLLMWHDLGRAFITGTAPLEIFSQTDPCHARIGRYMYVVQGGDIFNGHHYFNLTRGRTQWTVLFGDEIPAVNCGENFMEKKILRDRIDYTYPKEFVPESFIVSSVIVRPALNALGTNTQPVFENIREELIGLSKKYGFEDVSTAERYWFWNMFASRTVEKLIKNGAIERTGNGQFRLEVRK